MNVKIGATYRHYAKYTLYKVIAITKDTESLEARIIYKELLKFDAPDEPIWDRPAKMWNELVSCDDGQLRPRFELVCEMSNNTKRDVFFIPDPFEPNKNKVNLGTVHDREGFYYNGDWDMQEEYTALNAQQQACVRLVLAVLRAEDWDNTQRLPASLHPQVVYGSAY